MGYRLTIADEDLGAHGVLLELSADIGYHPVLRPGSFAVSVASRRVLDDLLTRTLQRRVGGLRAVGEDPGLDVP